MSTVTLDKKTILVTGAAGFIGSNLVKRIYQEAPSATVIGIDNMNDYYDVALKEFRLNELAKYPTFTFVKGNIADKALITELFEKYKPSVVVNLAAQAGVRYSITNPDAYVESNLVGFFNILEACRHCESLEHLVYSSSSSVYGSNKKVPYSTDDKVDNPVSLYAATKKSNELMAHAYSKLYNIPSTGLRFFTVYGPAGRPDMAYFGFTNKLVKGETIKIFNYGNCKRDFTYVDDIVEGVVRVMKKAPDKKNGEDGLPIPPYAVYNIGNQNPENLLDFVQILSEELDKELITELFEKYKPSVVVNLAAQAGVRYSITNPDAYVESNLVGFFNILEACRHCESLEHLVYASSSSVYGSNKKVPYSTEDKVDNPVSLYAATKKSNELMAHAYSKLYNISSTGLRFFTVYGPAGRPDMAYFGFTNKLVKGETIKIFNYGNCKRDFTYVDDIVEGVVRVMKKAPDQKNGEDGLPIPPYAVYNIGNQNPENLLDFVQILSEELVRAKVLPEDYDFEAHKELVPMQPGDVPVTYADTSALERDFGYKRF